MRFLLDTNAWIRYLNPGTSGVKDEMLRHRPSELALCDVVKAELLYGAWKSARREANLERLGVLFSQFTSLPFDARAAEVYGRLRADLEFRGTPIGPYDLMIASICLAHELVLVSANQAEFSRIEGLKLENWEAGLKER